MARFNYKGLDSKGVEKEGTIEADNETNAVTRLKTDQDLRTTHIVEIKEGKKAKDAKGAQTNVRKAGGKMGGSMSNLGGFFGGGRVKAKTLCIFTRQLATLVDAGLPLLRGLAVLMRQEKNPVLRQVLADLTASVESGSTFSEALFAHPKIFSKLYINMVKAGEVGGVLEVVLNRLSQFMEKAEKIKGKVKAAMFYPIAVMVIATGIMAFLMIKIVPQFEVIFTEMLGTGLPGFTVFVLNISRACKNHFILVVLSGVAIFIAIKMYGKTKGGRLVLDKLFMKAPVVGDLVRKTSIARFTRTLGTLVSSGVPILQSLIIVRDTSGNRVIADAVAKIHDSVKEGESIVTPLEASGVFPPMVVSMIDVGETTGALPDMLMKIADNYEEEVDNAVTAMVSLLEPLMIVFLAVVVGSIVIALFLPLIKIITTLGQESTGT